MRDEYDAKGDSALSIEKLFHLVDIKPEPSIQSRIFLRPSSLTMMTKWLRAVWLRRGDG